MGRTLADKIKRAVRSRLAGYLARTTTLRVFLRWFMPATWNVNDDAPAELRKLVYEIKMLVDDYGSGCFSEDQLRAELLPFVEPVIIIKQEGQRTAQEPRDTSASASFKRLPDQWAGWLLRPAVPQLSGLLRGSYRRAHVFRLRPSLRFEPPVESMAGSARNRLVGVLRHRRRGAASV